MASGFETGRFSPCANLSSSTPGQGFWFLHEVAGGQRVAFYVAHSPTHVASDGAGMREKSFIAPKPSLSPLFVSRTRWMRGTTGTASRLCII
jgi:hypothetical protein